MKNWTVTTHTRYCNVSLCKIKLKFFALLSDMKWITVSTICYMTVWPQNTLCCTDSRHSSHDKLAASVECSSLRLLHQNTMNLLEKLLISALEHVVHPGLSPYLLNITQRCFFQQSPPVRSFKEVFQKQHLQELKLFYTTLDMICLLVTCCFSLLLSHKCLTDQKQYVWLITELFIHILHMSYLYK